MQQSKKTYLLMKSIIQNNHLLEEEFIDHFCSVLSKTTKKVLDIDATYLIEINNKTKDLFVYINAEVVNNKTPNLKINQILLPDALKVDPTAKIGTIVKKIVDFDDFSHYFVQYFRQFLANSLHEVKHKNDQAKALKLLHTVIWAEIEEIHDNKMIVSYDSLTMILPKKYQLKSEQLQPKKNYYFFVQAVDIQSPEITVILSRTAPELVLEIIKKEVPEVETNFVQIKQIVRCPDEKSKVIVSSTFSNIDPVGACIGPQAQRIKNIIQYINYEKIDFIEDAENEHDLILNFFNNVTVHKILPLKTNEHFQYFREDDNLGYCIILNNEDFGKGLGKRYVNNRLLDKLTNKRNLILTLENAIEKHFLPPDYLISNTLIEEKIISQSSTPANSSGKDFKKIPISGPDDENIEDKYKNIIQQYLIDEEEDMFNLDSQSKPTPKFQSNNQEKEKKNN